MSDSIFTKLRDRWAIVGTIAGKDIVDALRNRLVLSLILMAGVILLMPKLLPYIFEPPALELPLSGPGSASLLADLPADSGLNGVLFDSQAAFDLALCSNLYPQLGLQVPAAYATGDPLELEGYTCWNRRFQATELQAHLAAQLTQALGRPVTIRVAGNLVHPSIEDALSLNIAAINAVVVLLTIGIVLVPSLLFEEKQAQTIQALLVSPASIGQVVAGKALVGFCYSGVVAAVIFTIAWADVVHWGPALVFVVAGGVFSVALGLVLGSFFEKPQDVTGLTTGLLLILLGAVIVELLGLALPAWVSAGLPWVPSVALAQIFLAVFREQVDWGMILPNTGILLAFSALLYILVIWKLRRSDR